MARRIGSWLVMLLAVGLGAGTLLAGPTTLGTQFPLYVHPARADDAVLKADYLAMCHDVGPEAYVRQQKAIMAREGWGEQSARKLFDAINRRREIQLDRFINALGIRHVGETTAKLLARTYHTAEAFIAAMESAGAVEELETIEGVGQTVAKAIS